MIVSSQKKLHSKAHLMQIYTCQSCHKQYLLKLRTYKIIFALPKIYIFNIICGDQNMYSRIVSLTFRDVLFSLYIYIIKDICLSGTLYIGHFDSVEPSGSADRSLAARARTSSHTRL